MKALFLWSALAATLFASAVPTADALPPPLFEKTRLIIAKQRNHIEKQLTRIFAIIGWTKVCGLPACRLSEIDEIDHIVEAIDINKTTVAQKLVYTLPILYGKFLSNKEENRLVYYAHGGEARIGWLTGEYGSDTTIVPYMPDNIKKLDEDSINRELNDLADSLPIASNLDVVHSSAVAGKLMSSGYPRYGVRFIAKDGIMVSGIVFGRLISLKEEALWDTVKKTWHAKENRTYVILVTHRDGQELKANDRYFTIIPSDLTDKYGTPPLLPLDDVAARASIRQITSPMYIRE